jgi:hypothetical protein
VWLGQGTDHGALGCSSRDTRAQTPVSRRTAGQEVVVTAVGAAYTSWEGYLDEATGRAFIGLSYDKLCQFLKPGNTILLSDGTITIKVCADLHWAEPWLGWAGWPTATGHHPSPPMLPPRHT